MTRALIVVLAVLFTPAAHAQFANRSVGGTAGYLQLDPNLGIEYGIPVGIEYSSYLENGFDWVSHAHGMIIKEPITQSNTWGFTLGTGIRYLFMEEHFRPYVGFDLSYLHIFGLTGTASFFGLVGPNVGFEYFVTDGTSLGIRGEYNLYFYDLNAPGPLSSFGAKAGVHFWF
jgi:outer membrane protein